MTRAALIDFVCPKCRKKQGAAIDFDAAELGCKVKCSSCGHLVDLAPDLAIIRKALEETRA